MYGSYYEWEQRQKNSEILRAQASREAMPLLGARLDGAKKGATRTLVARLRSSLKRTKLAQQVK